MAANGNCWKDATIEVDSCVIQGPWKCIIYGVYGCMFFSDDIKGPHFIHMTLQRWHAGITAFAMKTLVVEYVAQVRHVGRPSRNE